MSSSLDKFGEKQSLKSVLVNNLAAKDLECQVRLTIHSVSELPLVSGAFRVRWKFRHVDSKAARKQHTKLKDFLSASGDDNISTPTLANPHPHQNLSLSSDKFKHSDPMLHLFPTDDSASSKPVKFDGDERGHTPFMKLRSRDHTVNLDHTVDVITRMRVVHGKLISEPLKLVVEQWQDPALKDSKTDTRIGHRYINLAEFVGEGKQRRKYLLDRSKTNAMVTVSLDIVLLKPELAPQFTKPELNTEHILIGKKEPRRPTIPLRQGSPNLPNSMMNLSQPGLERASTKTTTTTASSSDESSPVSTSLISQTEAVIEALFNPPTSTPASASVDLDQQSITPSRTSSISGTSRSDKSTYSLNRYNRSPLGIVLEMNNVVDSSGTARPSMGRNVSSTTRAEWEIVGSTTPNVKVSPERKSTKDSVSTTHSGSSKAEESGEGNQNNSPNEADTTDSAREDGRGRWFSRWRKVPSRSGTPVRDSRASVEFSPGQAVGRSSSSSTLITPRPSNTTFSNPSRTGSESNPYGTGYNAQVQFLGVPASATTLHH